MPKKKAKVSAKTAPVVIRTGNEEVKGLSTGGTLKRNGKYWGERYGVDPNPSGKCISKRSNGQWVYPGGKELTPTVHPKGQCTSTRVDGQWIAPEPIDDDD